MQFVKLQGKDFFLIFYHYLHKKAAVPYHRNNGLFVMYPPFPKAG